MVQSQPSSSASSLPHASLPATVDYLLHLANLPPGSGTTPFLLLLGWLIPPPLSGLSLEVSLEMRNLLLAPVLCIGGRERKID